MKKEKPLSRQADALGQKLFALRHHASPGQVEVPTDVFEATRKLLAALAAESTLQSAQLQEKEEEINRLRARLQKAARAGRRRRELDQGSGGAA